MSHTVTPVAKPATITVPDDGEAAVATAPGVPASRVTLEEVVQALADNTAAALAGAHGFIDRRELVVTYAGVLRVGPFGRLVLDRADGTREVFSSVAPITITPGSLSANTHYYVYAWNNAGVLSWLVSATVPDDALQWKSDDATPTHRYIGSFKTTFTATLMPQVLTGGVCLYSSPRVPGFEIATAVGIGAGRASYAHKAPPIARKVRAFFEITATTADGVALVYVGASSLTTLSTEGAVLDGQGFSSLFNKTFRFVEVANDRSSSIDIECSTNTHSVSSWLAGWSE